ncbi:MAG TPA: hypothetical protein VKZ41_03230 [Gemmatimonadales bacterium]|nr:hypothetical protein [Gemmatimonadales bacterium]
MNSDAPDNARRAFAELRRTVTLLGEELASFRRRAQTAEARVRELERDLKRADERASKAELMAAAPLSPDQVSRREALLRQENEQLRERLGSATSRLRVLLGRLRFLREQESQ